MKKKKRKSFRLCLDRSLAHSLLKQGGLLCGLLCLLFAVSFLLLSLSGSEWEAFCAEKNLHKWLLPFYLLIDTNALNGLYMDSGVHGWMLFASSLIYLVGLFVFNGMIISLMTNAVSLRVERHNNGRIHYLESGHYIIMGYDDICPSIADAIFARDPGAYILMLTSADPGKIRERLRKNLGEKLLKRVIINYGHRMSREAYGDLCLERAEEVFIVGNRSLPAHDAINVECVDNICAYLRSLGGSEHPARITCVFEDLDTYAAFKTSEIFGEVRDLGIEFIPYNFYAGWAHQVFVRQCYRNRLHPENEIRYPAVYGSGIREDDDRCVHLVFVGTTHFAVAFAMEAAHVLHFPNFVSDSSRRTRITFIDLNADRERHLFMTRNRHFFDVQEPLYRDLSDTAPAGLPTGEAAARPADGRHNFLDVEFEFIKGDVFSETVRAELVRWAVDPRQHLSIFLAMTNQRDNFAIGMNMPDAIYDGGIPLFIRQDRSANFVTNLRRTDSSPMFRYWRYDARQGVVTDEKRSRRYACIYPFGMTDTGYCADELALQRAKLINYLYKTADYKTNTFVDRKALNAMPRAEILDKADRLWRELEVAKKWSNLYCAYSLSCKLASLRAMRGGKGCGTDPLTEHEIRLMAVVEHNRWNVEKLLMGYRKPMPEEDKYLHPEAADQLSENKNLFIHHDIRPYDELDGVRKLDIELTRCIPWLLTMTGPAETMEETCE